MFGAVVRFQQAGQVAAAEDGCKFLTGPQVIILIVVDVKCGQGLPASPQAAATTNKTASIYTRDRSVLISLPRDEIANEV